MAIGTTTAILIGAAAIAAGTGASISAAHQERKAAKTAANVASAKETAAKLAAASAKTTASANAKSRALAYQQSLTQKVFSTGKTLGATASDATTSTLGS